LYKHFFKILFIVWITSYLYGCDVVKKVAEDEHLLSKTTVIVNDKKDNTETVNNLLYQKANKKILGIPLRMHIHNTARSNRDSIFEAWLDKKPNRRARLKRRYSQKQLDKIKESALKFNSWLKKNGEAPVIVSEAKTNRTIRRLNEYYINNGWFDIEADYIIEKKDNKRAEIQYKVKTNKPFIIDSISKTIQSPIIDSLYNNIKKEALIKSGDQYRSSNFEQERERITKTLRNLNLIS